MDFKFNIPNKITIIRVSLIPLFAVILLANIPYKNILSAFIFGMLSISDFLDGYFARKKNQVTEFGKLIDPIADKLLVSTALVFLLVQHYEGIDLWMAAAIIAREFILTAIRIYLLPRKIVVPASNFGKAKTVVQSIAIVFVLLNLPLSWHAMLLAVAITLISGADYLWKIRKMTGNEIVNLPNLITLCRFLLIIPFAYSFLSSNTKISLLIFVIIALSDKLDGISARIMHQKTELGSGLDAFTDWTLINTTFILLVMNGHLSAFWVILLIIPSMLSGTAKMVCTKRQKIVPVTIAARLCVGLTYITITSLLVNIAYSINFGYNFYLLTATVVMAYLSMIWYVFKALRMPKLK